MTENAVEIFKLEQWIAEHDAKMAGFLVSRQIAKASKEAALLCDARKALAELRIAQNTIRAI